MKSKSFMLMVLSMGFGLIAAIGISQVMGSKGPAVPAVKMGPVLIASDYLEHKTELSEENCGIENWPETLIPEGAATNMEDVLGKVVTTPLRKGQVMIMADILDRSQIVDLAIPPGHKVINIKVPAEDTMSGLLSPGAKVDIIGVFPVRTENRNGGGSRTETRTFLKAIRVFNVNGSTTTAQHKEGKGSGSGIVGVIVTERQAEKIVWVKKEGDIRLALRGEADMTEPTDVDDPFFNDILSDSAPESVAATKTPKFDPSTMMEIFHGGGDKERIYFNDNNEVIKIDSTSSDGGGYGSPGVPAGETRDYEDSEDSVDVNHGDEEDQYQGE